MRTERMPIHSRFSASLLLGALLLLLLVNRIPQVETQEAEQPSTVAPRPVSQQRNSISGVGETYELTIAYSRVKADEILPLRLFLANLETNKPVAGADLTLTMSGPGAEQTIKPTATDSPGEYRAEIKVKVNVPYSILVEVSTKDSSDLFSIDDFKVMVSPPSASVTSQGYTSNWIDYLPYFAIGIAVIVALVSYQLGRRKRAQPSKEVLTDTREETS